MTTISRRTRLSIAASSIRCRRIWLCHILSPFQYREDCIKIVGKVVDHQPYKLCETKKPLSERYWKEKYPNVPFDIDLTDATPFLIEKNYEQKSAYDIASATLRQRLFNYATHHYLITEMRSS